GKFIHEPMARGEVVIRGPNVMKGYWNKPEATAAAIDAAGWFHSGDVGYYDADRFLYICDRVKDMVIVSGFKVFTREIDEVLAKHRDVLMAAAIGLPDPERPGSERVGCAVVLREGVEKSEEEKEKLRAYLREEVAPYKVPRVIEFMDELPTSGVGKILKRELKKIMAGGGS
ncbi:MAG: AMP-binding protein, partial [Spirochaetes bacterium]|nr:AMP-binding protein [Spirochaetota bacterium]